MKPMFLFAAGLLAATAALAASPAGAATLFDFSTGSPDGRLGALSQPNTGTHIQTETADDFILNSQTRLTGASFTGLLPTGTDFSNIKDVEIEIYHVFPGDSNTTTRTIGVPTRMNSPGDTEIGSATRDAGDGTLSFDPQLLNDHFSVTNTVGAGIRGGDAAAVFTGADPGVTGQEVRFNITFDDPLLLDAGHFFFRPEVELVDGSFFWLSSPRPIGEDGTPFNGDLQAWIRNDNIAPDWLRIGTDVTHQSPFNMAFSLTGVAGVPEPASWALMIGGFGLMGATLRRRREAAVA